AALPLTAERVLHRVRETRGGKLYDSRFGVRGRGEGTYAEAIHALFETAATRAGFRLDGAGLRPAESSREGAGALPGFPAKTPGAIPSDVQVDAQQTRASGGCLAMALPAPRAEPRQPPVTRQLELGLK